MVLEQCIPNKVGTDKILTHPFTLYYDHAIVSPTLNRGSRQAFGVFDIYGRLILLSALLHGKEHTLSEDNPDVYLNISLNMRLPEETKIYWGGVHFGSLWAFHYGCSATLVEFPSL